MKFNSLIPELSVTDIEQTRKFYCDVLGFKIEYPFGRGINFEIGVSDVESIYNRVKAAGIKLFADMEVSSYRNGNENIIQKEFLVQDPDGYLLRFAQ